MRVLLVEDEVEMATALRRALLRHDVVVDHVGTLEGALEAIRSNDHDAVLLDRNLPDGEGLSAIADMRRFSPGVAVIVLTASGSVDARVEGLDEGADDYLAKPFAIEELLARLRAVRRRPKQIAKAVMRLGRMEIDMAHGAVSVDGGVLRLRRRERLVLETLVRRQGLTVAREVLVEAAWGFDDEIQSNTLDAHISRLRTRLMAADAGVEIHAVRGVGYFISETDS